MHPRRIRPLQLAPIALCLGASTCDLDPAASGARAYHDAVLPLLVENADMARDFRDLAATIKKKDPEAKSIARLMRKKFVPAAEDLADRAQAIHPEAAELQAAHTELVTAWTTRADAYEDLHAAWQAQDLEAFDEAAEANLLALRHEDRFYLMANEALAPYQLSLPAYPQQVATE